MIGVVDVGGGLRGIFGAGVFDYCIDRDISFDYGIGVSAGSANVASYIAGQKGRNYKFYIDYSFRKEYMSFSNFIKRKGFVDLEYVYTTLSVEGGENPLDFDKITESDKIFKIVATGAMTGQPVYFDKADMSKNNYDAIKASCSLPVVNKPYIFAGSKYYDGGLSDPIPFEKALSDGCDKVVVILTRPVEFRRDGKQEQIFAKLISRKYPLAARALANRHIVYNRQLERCVRLQEQGITMIIAPDNIDGLGTLTKNKQLLFNLYKKGYDEAEKIIDFID